MAQFLWLHLAIHALSRASSSPPRPVSDPERNLGCALGRGASPRARVAVAPPWRRMCRARNEDEWTVAPGQRDEVSDDASVDDAGGNDDVPDLASYSSSETEPPTARPTSEPSPEAMTEPTSSTSEPTAEPTFEPTSGAPTAEPAVELGTPRDGVGLAVGALPEGGGQPGVPVVVAFGAGFGAGWFSASTSILGVPCYSTRTAKLTSSRTASGFR